MAGLWGIFTVPDFQHGVKSSDVGTPGDGHPHSIRLSRADSDAPTDLHEQPEDVRGVIGERVGRIVSTVHDASMSAPVGFQAAPDELPGMALDDLSLPCLEHDRTPMLSPRTMLWEELRPCVTVAVQYDAGSVMRIRSDPMRRQ
jgi:hypothetical protein